MKIIRVEREAMKKLCFVGIKEKIGYLREINVDAVWLSPFYPSPDRDFGYDVSNYTDVDSQFGTMDDFDELLKEMHKSVNGTGEFYFSYHPMHVQLHF